MGTRSLAIPRQTETKKTSFTEKLTAMVGMRPKDKEEKTVGTTKSKTIGIVSAITTADDLGDLNTRTVGGIESHTIGSVTETKIPPVEMRTLMRKKEVRYYQNEKLDNGFTLARATEEKLRINC